MLVELAAYRLDVVLADDRPPSGVNAKVFNHLLGECGVTFCAETKLARKLKRGFPKSLNGVGALLPMANSGLRRSLEKWFHASGVRAEIKVRVLCKCRQLSSVLADSSFGFKLPCWNTHYESNAR